MAYADGDFARALSLYDGLRKQEKRDKAFYRIQRARIFGRLAQPDSAIAELKAAIEEMRAKDAKDLVILYNSKAVLEHSMAIMLEQKNDDTGAREAYGRALQEDLSYYPAHVRLGMLAVAARDSTSALSELELAVQIAPNEPYPRLMLASTLVTFGQDARALPHLQKAVELEPHWAAPYATMGQVLHRQGDGAKALEAYQAFVSRAARNHPLLGDVRSRMEALKAGRE
jgi:tetratricopeptide (TPR) repeat protein